MSNELDDLAYILKYGNCNRCNKGVGGYPKPCIALLFLEGNESRCNCCKDCEFECMGYYEDYSVK